jgi:hypothetical protein
MITRLRYPKGYQFFSANGAPLALGNLYYYQAGTATPQDTYSDSAGAVPNTNPIVLDASGRLTVDVYLGSAGASYKEVLTTGSATVAPWPDDYIPAATQPDWSAVSGPSQILNKPVLATVATSGSYADLSNRPSAFAGDHGSGGASGLVPAPQGGDAAANKFLSAGGDWASPSGSGSTNLSMTQSATTVGIGSSSGTGVTIPAANSSSAGVLDSARALKIDGLATVATSGSYADLTNKPAIPSIPGSLAGQNIDNTGRLGINTTDSNNPLSVNGPSVLFSNSGDVRAAISKGAAANTAAVTLQDNFSTRAQLGLIGNDNFTIVTSPDGAVFNNAIVATASGAVSFPNTAGFAGDSGSGGASGLVPATGAGDAAAGKFLKADGSWSVPGGGGSPGGSSGQLQFNSSGTFAGAAALVYAASGTNLTVTAQNAADVPLLVKGKASQTGNLFEARDSSNTLLARLTKASMLGIGTNGNVVVGNENAGSNAGFTSQYSTIIGSGAVTGAHTGTYTTAIGYGAGASLTSASFNVLIGGFAGGSLTTGSQNVCLGGNSGAALTSGTQNICVGYQAGQHTTANYNTFIGVSAGQTNTTGTGNAYIGANAGQSATGSYNFGLGQNALKNVTGNLNVAIGHQSMMNATTAYNNIAIGPGCLFTTQSGYENIAIGDGALYNLGNAAAGELPATLNVAIGTAALGAATTAFENVAVGAQAMHLVTTGNMNVACGCEALLSLTTGTTNTALGVGGLHGVTTGNNNIGIGNAAGGNYLVPNRHISGSNCTFLGSYTLPGSPTQHDHMTVIGSHATGDKDNAIFLGRAGTDDVYNGRASADGVVTYTQLAAITATAGMEINVSDATVNTWGATVSAGSGAYNVKARYNGTAWTVVGI